MRVGMFLLPPLRAYDDGLREQIGPSAREMSSLWLRRNHARAVLTPTAASVPSASHDLYRVLVLYWRVDITPPVRLDYPFLCDRIVLASLPALSA